jgi:hypothetical protein
MAGLTIVQKHEKIRNAILDALLRNKNLTARQISYELSQEEIWRNPDQVAFFIRSDERLKRVVETEFIRRNRWSGLVYRHVRNGSWGAKV